MTGSHGKHVYVDYNGYNRNDIHDGAWMLEKMIAAANAANVELFTLMLRNSMERFHPLDLLQWYYLMRVTSVLIATTTKGGLLLMHSPVEALIQMELPTIFMGL